MNCPECDSENLYRKGKRNGRQRYQCKDCGRYFVEGTTFIGRQAKLPKVKMNCPHCGEPHIIRDGLLESGKQRYKCLMCKKSFSSETVIPTPVYWNCPVCGGGLKRAGKSKTGKNAYKCKQCGRTSYGDPPIIKIKFKEINTSLTCPHCDSDNIVMVGTGKGKQRYKCKNCNKIFNEDTKERLREKELSPRSKEICPRCGSNRITCAGLGKTGKQRYKCLACKRSYTKGAKLVSTEYHQTAIKDTDKKAILMYKFNFNMSIPELAKSFKYSANSIKQLINEYKNKIPPTTEKQIQRVKKLKGESNVILS